METSPLLIAVFLAAFIVAKTHSDPGKKQFFSRMHLCTMGKLSPKRKISDAYKFALESMSKIFRASSFQSCNNPNFSWYFYANDLCLCCKCTVSIVVHLLVFRVHHHHHMDDEEGRDGKFERKGPKYISMHHEV